jgi:hypothetical protein
MDYKPAGHEPLFFWSEEFYLQFFAYGVQGYMRDCALALSWLALLYKLLPVDTRSLHARYTFKPATR